MTTKAEWDAMKRRDKDAIVVETVMGWVKLDEPEFIPPDEEMDWRKPNGYASVLPMFTTDRNACALVLDEIERHGADTAQTMLLLLAGFEHVHKESWPTSKSVVPPNMATILWAGLRADPDTICYCAVKAVSDD